jgi:hypothetical protein
MADFSNFPDPLRQRGRRQSFHRSDDVARFEWVRPSKQLLQPQ